MKTNVETSFMLLQQKKLQTLEQHSKNPNRRLKASDAQGDTVKRLGYGSTTVAKVMKEFKHSRNVVTSVGSGNRTKKKSRVPNASVVINDVRMYVRQRRMIL